MSAVRARWRSQDGGARGQDRGDGRKAGGGPPPSIQVNLTDEESRIMPVTCGRFEQFYNARAAVVTGSLMAGERRGARPSDKNQVEPMPKKIEDLPEEMGKGRKSAGGVTISAPRM